MVTFSSWTDTRQFSAAPNSYWYLILLFWKMMSFGTKRIVFFGAKLHCFFSCSHSFAKAVRYADKTLSFQDSAMQATQCLNIFNNINTDYTSIPTVQVLFLSCVAKRQHH